VDLRQLDDEALAGHLDQLVDEVLTPNLRAHFRLVLPDIVALHDLAVCCRDLLGWDDGQMLELLAGLSATATQPALELAEVSELAGADAVSQGLGAVRATSAGPRLDAWLNCWGLRALEFDPGAPTVSEQESLVLKLLRQPQQTTAPTAHAREQARARARVALGDRERARFDEVLHIAERVHPQREENVLYTQSLPMGLVRRALLEIGRRLAAAGALAAADDVVYLERAEIRPALEGRLTGEATAVRVRRRQAERRWVRVHPGPTYHGPPPFPPPSTRGLPGALRRLLDAFIWETALETAPEAPASGSGMLSGAGASAGRATGRVRVIRGEDELPRFEGRRDPRLSEHAFQLGGRLRPRGCRGDRSWRRAVASGDRRPGVRHSGGRRHWIGDHPASRWSDGLRGRRGGPRRDRGVTTDRQWPALRPDRSIDQRFASDAKPCQSRLTP
jgi:pyruvate,water dikinase